MEQGTSVDGPPAGRPAPFAPTSLDRLIDRLQAAGLVRREPSPHDARGTYTVITEDGIARLRAAAPYHLASVQRAWMQHFSDDELRTIAALLARIRPVPE